MGLTNKFENPAEVYDSFFVPALFSQWAPVLADMARVGRGDRVLDVACGTGALTVALADRVGPEGTVVGLDVNSDMLSVARRKPARIRWIGGSADALPLPESSFDAVVSQFGLMFFGDRAGALESMARVLSPGGRMVVAVCGPLQDSPGYETFSNLLERLFGREVGDSFRAPFELGDSARLRLLSREAGLEQARIARRDGHVRFASIASLIASEKACTWTLGGMLDDDQFERLLVACEDELRPFVAEDGTVVFDMPVLFLLSGGP